MQRTMLATLYLLSLALLGASAGENPAPTTAVPAKDIERLGEGRFRIGNILLDKTSETLRFPAAVNMQEGIVELVACSSAGKLHESVFLADIEPYHLQLALLLLGLEPKGGVQYQGDPTTPRGDHVLIWVERDGQRRRVEDYVWDLPRQAPMERTSWVFTGSKFVEGQFGAQVTRTLITTYHDPYTILDNPLPTGGDDTVYEANKRVAPAVGTTVTLVIQPVKPRVAKGETK